MKYGLIGEKLGHSYSKIIHEKLAPYQYTLFPLSKEEFPVFMEARDFDAINVTIPYKEAVLKYLDEIDETAAAIGAVNTIVKREGKLYGYNTDAYGFSYLLKFHDIDVKGKNCFCLGNGGAAKAVMYVLRKEGALNATLVSRTKTSKTITYQELIEDFQNAEIIINTTPVGMYPNVDETPISLSSFPSLDAVVDIIYNPLETKLTKEASKRNRKNATGLMMLVAQAAKAIEYFIGKKITEEEILEMYQHIK